MKTKLLMPFVVVVGIYNIGVTQAGPIADYGDAPDSYQTLFNSGGPYHINSIFEWIGVTPTDTESDGQPDPLALGDDNNGLDDEETVIPQLLTPGNQTADIIVSVADHNSGRYGSSANQLLYLEGWIDFDHGGTFENALGNSEQFVKMTLDPSLWTSDSVTLSVNFTVPSGQFGASQETYGRLRLNYGQGYLGYTGGAQYGEVEDFGVEQACPPILPEPSTLLLFGLGLFGFPLVRRRVGN